MVSKSHPISSPPQISLADQLLSSKIPLPTDPCVAYALFTPDITETPRPPEIIELARRHILSKNASSTLIESLLPSVQIGASSFMYVFLLSDLSRVSEATSTLTALHLGGLTASEISFFALKDLYPCSPTCSLLPRPCTSCVDRCSSSSIPAALLPRKPLRTVYSHFLEAIRIRLLNDVSEVSISRPSHHQVKRLKGGFLLGSSPCASEWGASWEYRSLSRPLLYCQLQVHLFLHPRVSMPSLIIHPRLIPTHLLPLAYASPVPSGTAIILLPHATPAYFLSPYSGPTSALKKQFQESLRGMGVCGWESSTEALPGSQSNGFPSPLEFIIAWINVENRQGEDKGIIILYPTSLCLSFVPSSVSSRPPLNFIPDLPAPLQSSPQVPPAMTTVPLTHSSPSSGVDTKTVLTSYPYLRPILFSPSAADYLRAFQTLTPPKSKDVRNVAAEVGGYVDAVARERDRERERLKRERENGTSYSPKLARATAPIAIVTDTPTPLLMAPTGMAPQSDAGPSNSAHITNFYPSPPQTNPPLQVSSAVEVPPIPAATAAAPPPLMSSPSHSPSPSAPVISSFEPLGTVEPTWSLQPQSYLGMDIDFDVGMDIGMEFEINSGSRNQGTFRDAGMDFDDATFTDDDFNFFDRPSARDPPPSLPPAPVAIHRALIPPMNSTTAGTSKLSISPSRNSVPLGINLTTSSPLYSGHIHFSGPVLPQETPTPHSHTLGSSPWIASTITEGFTPRFSDPTIDESTFPPDLLPPSPGQTPSSHSAPSTPVMSVQLESDPAIIYSDGRGGYGGLGVFDPIPFSMYHRELDGKYAIGKFSLPSSPEEGDRTQPLNLKRPLLGPSHFPKFPDAREVNADNNGWRFRYKAATDPRVGVVRKLIGVKRKMSQQGGRDALVGSYKMTSPSWVSEHEDWERHPVVGRKSKVYDVEDDTKSDCDSDDIEDIFEDSESPIISRPSTPPPLYLSLGPTLLHTQFQHSEILPLSTPLRPPGAAVAPTNIAAAAAPASVPTPVSPAAALGANSEKSKSLEAAAFTVATEVVENPPWAEAWHASTISGLKKPSEVWFADVRIISQLLAGVRGIEGPLELGALIGPESTSTPAPWSRTSSGGSITKRALQMMDAPRISIGKGNAIIQILPTAIRFWEKLGLGPRGGKKNGAAFVLFEDDGEEKLLQIKCWMETVTAMYESKHLGTLVPGKSSSCSMDGLLPSLFDATFRRTLSSFIASLPASQPTLIFVVTPTSAMSFASPTLRQVISAIKKALKTHSEAQIHFQLVPEQFILGNLGNPGAELSNLEVFCVSLYDRILIPVDRTMSRRFFDHGERVRKYFQEPALTLSRPLRNKVSFVRAAHPSLDVMDRNTFLHVGYQVSPCRKWVLAACVDERGEEHDLGVWLTQTPVEGEGEVEVSPEMYVVKKVWDFMKEFAKKADVEWRVVIAKLGNMDEVELNAWASFLDAVFENRAAMPRLHVTLLSVESDAPWTFCSSRPPPTTPVKPSHSNRPSTSKVQPQTIFTDITTTIYSLGPYNNLPQSLPPDLGLSLSFIPDLSSSSSPSSSCDPSADLLQSSFPHPLSLLPLSTTSLICIPTLPSPTAITMLHIHLLHTTHSHPHSHSLASATAISTTTEQEFASLHIDITRNFHDLAVLAAVRWRLDVNPALPLHLAAVEAMRIALDRDRHGLDGVEP